MKRTLRSTLAALVVAMLMALTTTVALASWDYEDCPPASQAGRLHTNVDSTPAAQVWENLVPPANSHAWNAPSK